jgi:predicted ATPase
VLRKLSIQSFKAFEDATVEFHPLTVIIGPNGSGKSTVLQAVELLGGLVSQSLPGVLESHGWDYKNLPRLKAPNREFGFVAQVEGQATLEWEIRLGARRRPGIAAERVTDLTSDETLMTRTGRTMERYNREEGRNESIRQTLTSSWLSAVDEEDQDAFPELLQVARWARRIYPYVALDPARLREPSRRAETVGASGENLAGFLRQLRERRPAAFTRIMRRLQARYPHVAAITLRHGTAGWTRIEVTEKWGGDRVTVNAKQVSDGLLRLLAISALHEVKPPPSVLMFDEIENGVHPHLLGGLISMLRGLAEKRETQVIVTTHSPIALNYVNPEHVLIASRRSSGAAALKSLAASDGYRELSSVFDPGELWYNVGEAKLLQRPRKRTQRSSK